ncbi:glycosyltransferase [Thiotrichales bacterium 19S9-11]|nr:glycosyltransferase [Thiotrichales bacterium 19S9-11]
MPQLLEGVDVIILDNHSDVDYKSSLLKHDDIKSYLESNQISVIRHRANVGMSANFMRAFEVCQSQWLWLLSDDDEVFEDSVAAILDELDLIEDKQLDSQIGLIKFSSKRCFVKTGQVTRSLSDLIDLLSVSVDYFNSFIFISNNVYHVPSFQRQIHIGYQYANTCVPHLIMVLYFMNQDIKNSIYLSEKQLLSYVVSHENSYSYGVVAGLGVGAIKNFILDITPKEFAKLEAVFAAHNDFKVVVDLFYYTKKYSNSANARYLAYNYFLQIKFARSFIHRVILRGFIFSLKFPSFFEQIVNSVCEISPNVKLHVVNIKQKYEIR